MSATIATPRPTSHRASYVPDWVSLFAGVGMMALLGLVIDPGDHTIEAQTFGVVAGLGYLLGFVLAEFGLPDLAAHFVSLLAGIAVALFATEPERTWSELSSGAIGELLRRSWRYVETMFTAVRNGDRLPDNLSLIHI